MCVSVCVCVYIIQIPVRTHGLQRPTPPPGHIVLLGGCWGLLTGSASREYGVATISRID